ncbi:MAG: cellulase family glycosylhydrolase [Cytophagales bacterium]
MKQLFPILALLCAVAFAQPSVKKSISKTLVEDFEQKDQRNSLNGYWYSFNDNSSGGLTTLKQKNWQECFVLSGGYQSKGMLSVDVILNKGTYQWQPYYCFATSIPKTSDFSCGDFQGLSYWHKGVGHKFRIETDEIEDYDFYLIPVPSSNDWTLVTIDFKMLNQGGWGKKAPLKLDADVKFVWELNESSGNFSMDNIYLLPEITYVKQNDMKILPPSIPKPLEVKGNVKSPLNELSQKYLTKGMNLTSWGEANKITNADPKSWKFNEKMIKLQAEQGFLGIRFPLDFDLYLVDKEKVLKGQEKKITYEPLFYALLDSMNNWTKKYNLSLTIDYHAYDGTFSRAASKDPVYRSAMGALWKVVAQHFLKEKRPDLFFELTNEPGLGLPDGEFIDQEDWNLTALAMIDSIRKVDKTRPIIFGDTKWYSLDELIKNKPFKDNNIIYCFHMYDPFIFTHQGASWTNMSSMKNIPFPYSPEKWSTEFRDFGVINGTPDWVKSQMREYFKEGNKQHIKNRLALVKNWAFEHNVPLICNEWGALSTTAKIEDSNAYFKIMGEIFDELDIAWQVWFGVADNEFKLLPGMAESLGLKQKK